MTYKPSQTQVPILLPVLASTPEVSAVLELLSALQQEGVLHPWQRKKTHKWGWR